MAASTMRYRPLEVKCWGGGDVSMSEVAGGLAGVVRSVSVEVSIIMRRRRCSVTGSICRADGAPLGNLDHCLHATWLCDLAPSVGCLGMARSCGRFLPNLTILAYNVYERLKELALFHPCIPEIPVQALTTAARMCVAASVPLFCAVHFHPTTCAVCASAHAGDLPPSGLTSPVLRQGFAVCGVTSWQRNSGPAPVGSAVQEDKTSVEQEARLA